MNYQTILAPGNYPGCCRGVEAGGFLADDISSFDKSRVDSRQPGLWGRVFGGGLAQHEAVDPSMLVAKGYGSASPLAGDDTLEGRFRNRRIEYRVVKPVQRSRPRPGAAARFKSGRLK
jgi:hypothetical protein